MNKRVPLLLPLVLFLCMCAGPLAAQSDSLIIQPGFGDPGSSANLVFIDLKNSTDVGKMQFTFNYNSSLLTVTDVVKTSRTESMSIFNWSEPVPGQVTVFIWDLEGDVVAGGSGSIVNVNCEVSSEAHYGQIPLTLSGVEVYDVAGGIIPTAIVNGIFTITQPDISLSALSHDYGDVIVGETSQWSVDITNIGTKELTLNYINSSSGEFVFLPPSYPVILPPGETLSVAFSFAPGSAGPKSSNILVFSDDPDEIVSTIVLTGVGIAPDISVSENSHDFGNVIGFSTAKWTCTISNFGSSASLTVSAITSNHSNFTVVSPSFPRIIPIDGSLDVTVSFTPSRLGLISGMLTVFSNDPDEGMVAVSLTGTGYYPAATIIVDGGEGQEDSQGNIVPISLDNEMAMALIQFTLSYPHTLLTITDLLPTGRVSSLSIFNWDEISPGIIDVFIAASSGSITGPGTGVIIQSIFDVDPGAIPGNAPLVISDVVFADKNSNSIPAQKIDGNFVIMPAPNIDLSVDTLQFGDVLVGDSLGLALPIYNVGTEQLTVDSISVDPAQFGYQFPLFPQVIDAGDSLIGIIHFKPTDMGLHTGTAVLFSDDPDEGQKSITLLGRGVVPDINIASLSLDFGRVWVSDTSTIVLPIFNVGTADLTIYSIIATPIQYEISSNPLPTLLAPGGSFDVTIDFHPTAVGQVNGSLIVQSDDPDEGTVVTQLSGVGIDPEIDFSATNHWYGDVLVGQYEDWDLTVRNLGLTDLVIDSLRSDHGDFQLVGPNLPYTISASGSTVATIRFSPSGIGSRTGTIRMYSNDRDESPTLLQVNGIGVVPDIHIPQTNHDFGNVVVNQTAEWILKVYNHDVGDLIVSAVTTNNSDFTISNPVFPDTVVFGDSLLVTVTFKPSKTGPISGIVRVRSNDPDESQLSVSVGGIGVVPDLSLSEINHYYGIGVMCDTVSWVLRIYNVGTADLNIDSVYTDTSDYAVLEPLFPQVVSPGETLAVVVGFLPSQLGSITGNLYLLTDDPDEALVEIGLSGVSRAPDVELSQDAHDFGAVPIGYTQQWSVDILNVGNYNLTIDSVYTSSSVVQIISPAFPQTILVGNSLSVTLSFAPESGGWLAANMTIRTDDCDERMVNVLLEGFGYAVEVAIPDTSAMPSQLIAIPVHVGNVSDLNIYSWEANLTYDAGLLTAVRASSGGSITEMWGSPTYSIHPGSIDIEMSGIVPLSGTGPLVFVTFQVDSTLATGDSSIIRIEDFRFNDGAPASRSVHGFFHVNRPPAFEALDDQTAHEGLALNFVVAAADPDRDPLTFWAANLPTGALFDSESRTFSWTPDFGSTGTYPGVTFYVSDGQFTDSTTITITVESSIRVAVTDTTRPAGVTFSLPIVLLDPLEPGHEVYSIDLTLAYDPDVLSAVGGTVTGTVTEGWGTWIHKVGNGQVTFGFAGITPLSGVGVLVYVNFVVSTGVQPGDSSVLTLTEFQFNDGDPAAFPLPGVLTIPMYSIGGTVRYYMEHSPGLPIDSVLMQVIGSVSITDVSDEEGIYLFSDLVGGLGYAIRPSKKGDLRDAIGSFDASLITRYVVGIDPLNPRQQTAADVTGNGKVSALDAAQILQFNVGLIAEFGIGREWMFLPGQRDYPVLDADHREQDFTGILFGDVSGNWGVSGTGKQLADSRQGVKALEIQGAPGQIVHVPISLSDHLNILAVDIDLSFDTNYLQVLEVTRTSLTSDFMLEYNVIDGQVLIAMAGTTPLRGGGDIVALRCQISPKARIGDTSPLRLRVRLNETWLPPISGMVKTTETLPTAYGLDQNYPNPFNPVTDIRYQIADSGSPLHTTLTVYNMLGQEVKELVDEAQQPGFYSITWDGKDSFGLEVASGIYFYRLDVGVYSSTKRMMLMK